MFWLDITSSANVFNLKSTFRTLSKRVHPDKNGDNASYTLAQQNQNLLDAFQYLKQEEETADIERQRHWERNRVFQVQREEEKKRENEKREKEEKIGLRNMNHLLVTTVLSISVRGKGFWYNETELGCCKNKERKRKRYRMRR